MVLQGNIKKGLIFVVSAPAGTGKTTLVHRLTQEFSHVVESISCTTRAPRYNETPGVHYHFIDKGAFEQKIAHHEFLEHAEIYGDYYGTCRCWLEEQQLLGKHVVLVIDTQGMMQLQEKIDAISIFILPPSLEVLKSRLIHRQTESNEIIEKRLAWATHEMKEAKSYDYQIVNDDLNKAYEALRSIVIAEEHKVRPI